jgi:hypothetical protein
MIVQKMITYVRQFIEAHDPIATKLATRFPFRRLADHCYRTYRWAQRIQEAGGHSPISSPTIEYVLPTTDSRGAPRDVWRRRQVSGSMRSGPSCWVVF